MSASTSVDTIPVISTVSPSQPAQNSSSKFGSRFRKLTGTLRSKQPLPSGEEITPFPLEPKTPPSTQTLTYNPSQLVRGEPAIASAIEPRRFETSPVVPSPPASAGPGLKGFMSRFRKSRPADPVPAHQHQERRAPLPSGTASLSPSSPNNSSTSSSPLVQHVQSAPATKSVFSSNRSSRPMTPQAHSFSPEPAIPEDSVAPESTEQETDALRQLFDAASNLGLDQDALTQLIARSPSTSSRATTLAKVIRSSSTKSRPKSPHSPVPTDGRPSIDATLPRPSAEIKQLNIRKNGESTTRSRQEQRDATASVIVRRTIILPSDPRVSAVEWNNLMRKQSSSRKRRSAGAGSTQSKGSVQDRVPTPPPNRSALKRFSNDSSPPLPHLANSFAQLDVGSSGQVEKSSSAYDSL